MMLGTMDNVGSGQGGLRRAGRWRRAAMVFPLKKEGLWRVEARGGEVCAPKMTHQRLKTLEVL